MTRPMPTKPRPGDIDDDVADWFEGTSAAEVAAAVAQVEREARSRSRSRTPPGGRLPRSRRVGGRAGASGRASRRPAGRPQGQQPPQQGNYPTQGYPGRDDPPGPPPGYQRPDDRPADPSQATAQSRGQRPDMPPPPGYPYQPPGQQYRRRVSAEPGRGLAAAAGGRRGRPAGYGDRAALRAAGVPVDRAARPRLRRRRRCRRAAVRPGRRDRRCRGDAIVPGPLVGHCSGASGLDVLGRPRGFSVHPLMTVTRHGADFDGVWAAVAGSDRGARWPSRTVAGRGAGAAAGAGRRRRPGGLPRGRLDRRELPGHGGKCCRAS